jgi:hypothetical protein
MLSVIQMSEVSTHDVVPLLGVSKFDVVTLLRGENPPCIAFFSSQVPNTLDSAIGGCNAGHIQFHAAKKKFLSVDAER